MKTEEFREIIASYFEEFRKSLSTEEGEWIIKGFIDIYKNVYTISVDTKVISKIIELMLFPVISKFATDHKFKLVLCEHQNHYPDITFIAPDNSKFAVDLKSTYRASNNKVNGFTLGAFTGYFRIRDSHKNVMSDYSCLTQNHAKDYHFYAYPDHHTGLYLVKSKQKKIWKVFNRDGALIGTFGNVEGAKKFIDARLVKP
tara:strand:- start:11588 stop:12187 length:600 start_codon:yes stop_codon:yes gene_type:complete